ncbi:DUF3604 domain-containing protein [Mesorhizobium sp. ZC-5]|uniref:DUF3604 domain-containing protein n=1 Tax=Mesorhizobium sp. ZC-5 TaxID=2986066 RepID=UPI0021E8272D|nr:DUF3604 domain-containing protein [Mesorhizobium sp. ZC-5]MCV3243097.1 DUF3604 domain-containing protein [Mesorhizobium sp. ZC-5]
MTKSFHAALVKRSPEPLDFYEASIFTARFQKPESDDSLVKYLQDLFSGRRPDLIVAQGGPAAAFVEKYRKELFSDTPVVISGVDSRLMPDAGLTANDTYIGVKLDLPAFVENILRVRPETTNIAVVVGNSPNEQFWARELRSEFQPFADRVKFEWLDELSLDDMLGRVADLPPRSAVLYFMLAVDGTGAVHPLDVTFSRLREVATVPVFGYADYHLGQGDGETHPFLSPNDEFANFERWDKGNLDLTVLKTPDMLEFEYARSALKNGLKLEAKLGVNPYKFGMVGSTDAHTGLSAVDEDNFFGKTSSSEPGPDRATHPFVKAEKATIMGWEQTASGYAGVWATENTREAIFDAMERKETYATTGRRMLVRFFGGFDFTADDANSRSPAIAGYSKGVPMGGDLTNAPAGKAPTFLVAALKDPIGANLDRYQIVKGWLDASGEVHEQVYDVAWAGDRKPGADRKLPPVGDTVDIANATWTNTIGAPELIAVWTDPEFDPAQRAFYYGRVIEIPTPRWTAYDAKYFGITMPPEATMTTTERAYTSPIWYTPK